MSKKIDENRDEEIQDEEVEDENDAAEDEENDSDSADEDVEEEDKKDEEEEDSEDDDADKEEEKKDEKKVTIPDKFKGKTAEEIAKSYVELEGMIADKALEMAQNFLKKNGLKATEEDKKEEEEEFDLGLTDEQIAKMSPKEFGKHLNRKITETATKIAQKTIERSNEVRTNVSREIAEASKSHPHLKENKEYREVVLSIIEAANSKGAVVTLKEACEKADRAMKIKVEQKKPDEKKPRRTFVEKQDGGDAEKVKTDEDRVKEGMMNAGGGGGFLKGLV